MQGKIDQSTVTDHFNYMFQITGQRIKIGIENIINISNKEDLIDKEQALQIK